MNPELKIEITSRHEHASERLRTYAFEKAAKLQRFHDRISRIQILFDGVGDKRPMLEIIVHVDSGHTFVAKEPGHLKETLDALIEKMGRQLKKDKEKLKDHHKPGGKAGGKPGGKAVTKSPAAAGAKEETFDDVVGRELRPRRARGK